MIIIWGGGRRTERWNTSYVKKKAAIKLLPFRISPRNSRLGYEKQMSQIKPYHSSQDFLFFIPSSGFGFSLCTKPGGGKFFIFSLYVAQGYIKLSRQIAFKRTEVFSQYLMVIIHRFSGTINSNMKSPVIQTWMWIPAEAYCYFGVQNW